jgi:nucleoside phosphorylase
MPAPDAPAVVVTAIPEELDPILRHLGRTSVQRVGGRKVYRTSVCSPRLLLASTGAGPRNAEETARELCGIFSPTALLGLGVAGALTSSLKLFELIASARLRNGLGEQPQPDRLLLQLATANGARAGTLITVDSPVVSASRKKSLAESLPTNEPAAVDMESAAWARGAAAAGVPFVVVRAIADGAEEELPDYLSACLGPDGGIRRTSVLRRSLARPSSVKTLLRMRQRVLQCGERLASFLTDFFVC